MNKLEKELEIYKQENHELRLRNEKIKNTISFRLGKILITGFKSYSMFVKIPYELLKLRRDVINKNNIYNRTSLAVRHKGIVLSQHQYFILRDKAETGFIVPSTNCITLSGYMIAESDEKANAAILTFDIVDHQASQELAKSLGLRWSEKVGMYSYLPTNQGSTQFSITIKNLPTGRLNVAARRWYSKKLVKISGTIAVKEEISSFNKIIENGSLRDISILFHEKGILALEEKIEKTASLSDQEKGSLLSALIKSLSILERACIAELVKLLVKKYTLEQNDAESTCQHLYNEGCYKEAVDLHEKVNIGLTHLQLKYCQDVLHILHNSFDIPIKNTEKKLPTSTLIRYSIHCSLPHHSNGYATRTHSVLTALKQRGLNLIGTTRPGYPWDVRFDTKPQNKDQYDIDGINYQHTRGLVQREMTISEYIEQASTLIELDIIKNGASIVHACSNYLNAFPSFLAARRLGIPFVYEVRGFWEITESSRKHGWEYSDKFSIDKKMESILLQNADAVITLTDAMKREIIERGVLSEKIFIAPNAVSIDKFTAIKKDTKLQKKLGLSDSITIGYVGSIVDYEGLDDLISACHQLLLAGYCFNILIVGDGTALPKLKSQVIDLGLERHVVFTGRVPHEDIVKYYSLIDIAPFPRKALEVCELVSPLKPFEAMALDKCVIASDVAAMKEFIIDGVNGFLFKKSDVQALRDILSKLIDNPALREKVINSSRAWVLSNRTWLKTGDIFERAYNSLHSLVSHHDDTISDNTLHKVEQHIVAKKSESFGILNISDTIEIHHNNPLWYTIPVKAGQNLTLEAAVEYKNIAETTNRKAVLLFNCIDSDGEVIDTPCGKTAKSNSLKAYFKYLPCTQGTPQIIHTFIVPKNTVQIKFGLCGFNQKTTENVYLNSLKITPKKDKSQLTQFEPPSPLAASISILGWPEPLTIGKPCVIGIMDEFTSGCFEQDLNLIQARPDNWFALAEKYQPEFFFIESAWKGNYGSWQYRVANYTNKPGQEIAHICQYARQKGIPTIFWNKEDPVHHEKFMCSAKLVDYIFTTDLNMTNSYHEKTGNPNVFALPFAAQPALHKPAPLAGRKKSICFAGSWYGGRHAEREEAMSWLLQAAKQHSLEIFDRNYGTDIFPFPDEFQNSIKGSLPYKALCNEYNRYRVFLNVNSVIDSPTMFSRRVFELMACGTPVVSTYAKGIDNLFNSDAVWLVNSKEEAEEALLTLMTDDREWRRRSLAGIREVFKEHTYAHRLNYIFKRLGSETRISTEPAVLLMANAYDHDDIERLVDFANSQEYRCFKIGVECRENALSLNKNYSDNIVILNPSETFSWLAKQQTSYVLAGWISSKSYYGEHYLRDLVNASIYEPEASGWAKAQDQDLFSYGGTTKKSAALWKMSEFIKEPINSHTDETVTHPNLYLADSSQYQHDTAAMQKVIGG
ncbi:glycosyltransferase [Aeromonas salmonicida]